MIKLILMKVGFIMNCRNCGAELKEGYACCPKCGTRIEVANAVVENTAYTVYTPPVTKTFTVRKIVFGVLALIVLLFFIGAAGGFLLGGGGIAEIQSVGGNTLEEAYYAHLGTIYLAYAFACYGLGAFFSTILVWIGFKK